MEDTDDTKTCTKCGETKARSEFNKDRSRRDGLRSCCKPCSREYGRRYHAANRESERERRRKYREENREACLERDRKYREENREALLERGRKYREENLEAIRERNRKRYRENWEAVREYHRKRHEERKHDPVYILMNRCTARLAETLKRLGLQRARTTLDYLGLQTWDQLVEHIEEQFAPDMGWHNHTEWDLDHIEPFNNVVTHDDFVRVAHHSTVQVLWKHENRSKHTRLDWSPAELDRD